MKVLMTFALLQATVPAWLVLAKTETTTHQLTHLERRNPNPQDLLPVDGSGSLTSNGNGDSRDSNGVVRPSRPTTAVSSQFSVDTSDPSSSDRPEGRSSEGLLRRQVKVPGDYIALERRAPKFTNQVAMHKRQVERDAVLH
ncbi:hypothetical protein H4R35_005615 [Dimargaris xerosporica]|nr:hypothetical protein H4R35_005615 [Dimargaris xerosporica]